jgi:hypothetical protein
MINPPLPSFFFDQRRLLVCSGSDLEALKPLAAICRQFVIAVVLRSI